MEPSISFIFEFFYECRKCKGKIPARFPDNMNPGKTVQQKNEYTFECKDGCPPQETK